MDSVIKKKECFLLVFPPDTVIVQPCTQSLCKAWRAESPCLYFKCLVYWYGNLLTQNFTDINICQISKIRIKTIYCQITTYTLNPLADGRGMIGSGSKIWATFVCGMVVLLFTTIWYATTVITINQNGNEVVRVDRVKCLDMDGLTSPSKFGEVTWPTLDFMGCSVFYRPAFSAFYRMFCKIANLWDIDLKFSGFISDVNIGNPAISMPRSCISRKQAIWVFLEFAEP